MDIITRRLFKNYLSNLQVNVIVVGYNNVGPEWRDIDYTPDYNKFYCICSGEGWLKIGSHEYYPRAGQIFLMPAGQRQSYSTARDNSFTKYWCHFTAKVGDMNIFDIIKLPDFIETNGEYLPKSIFNDLLEQYNGVEITSPLLLKACILNLISYYLEHSDAEISILPNITSTGRLSNVIRYIDDNFNRNISIEDLSGLVYLHPNYFIKLFKKSFGVSPIHYINKRRIEEAKSLIVSSSFSLSEICDLIGINDVYYFSKLFKNYTGFSPSKYRQLHKLS